MLTESVRTPDDEEKDEIVRLFNGDPDNGLTPLTAGQIALRLGLTRNQVIGIVVRRRNKDPKAVTRAGIESAPSRAPIHYKKRVREPTDHPRSVTLTRKPAAAPRPPAQKRPSKIVVQRPPPPSTVTFIGTHEIPDAGFCKAINGDAWSKERQYCAQPVTIRADGGNSAYCAYHDAAFHIEARPWRRDAKDAFRNLPPRTANPRTRGDGEEG